MPQLWRQNSRSSPGQPPEPPPLMTMTTATTTKKQMGIGSFMTQCSPLPLRDSCGLGGGGGQNPQFSPPVSPKHYDRLLEELRHAQEKRGRLLDSRTNGSSHFTFETNSSSPPPLPPPSPPPPLLTDLRRNLRPVEPPSAKETNQSNGFTPKASKKVRFLEDGTGNLHTSVFGGSSESVGSLLDSHQDLQAMSPTPTANNHHPMDDIDSLISSLTNFDARLPELIRPMNGVPKSGAQNGIDLVVSPTETLSSSSSLGDHHHLLMEDEEEEEQLDRSQAGRAEVVDQRQATVIFHLEPDDPNSIDSGSVLSELDFEETSSTITETYSVINNSPDPLTDHRLNFPLDDRNDDPFAEVSDLLERSLQEIRRMEDSCSSTGSLQSRTTGSSSSPESSGRGSGTTASLREPLYELIGWKRRNNPPVQLDLKGAKPFPLPETTPIPSPPPPPPPPPVDDIWVPRQDFVPQESATKAGKRPAPAIPNGNHQRPNGNLRMPGESNGTGSNAIYGRLWETGASASNRSSRASSGDEVNGMMTGKSHPPADQDLSAIRSMARRARLEHWKLTGIPAGSSPTSPTGGIQLTWPPPPLPQSSCSSSATATPVTPTLPPLPAGFGDDPAIQHSSPKCLGHGPTFKWPVPPTNRPIPPVRKSSSAVPATSVLTSLKPANLEAAQDWYWTEEFPRAAGLEPGTGNMSAWFHGAVSRAEAERRLVDRPVGAFLARLTERLWGYALSVRNPSGGVSHFLVDAGGGRRGHHRKYTLLGSPDPPHKSLRELIQHYGKNPLSPDGLEKLLFPCPQESSVPCPPPRS